MSNQENKDDYKTVVAKKPQIKRPENTPGWLGRKYLKIRKAISEFWVVGKFGFQLGGAAGLILGFFVGGFQAIQMKSLWPLPLAMIGSGFTFGCIFSISTLLRSKEGGDLSDTPGLFAYAVYYDDKENKFIRTLVPCYAKNLGTGMNNRI